MVFIWYLLRFCLMTVALVVLVLGLYITLANAGLIRIPTYERSRIEASEEELREGRKDVAGLLPDTCLYGIYDSKGEYLEGNFPERLQEEAWEITADDGYTGRFYNTFYMRLEREDGKILVIRYQYIAKFENPLVRRLFPYAEFLFLGVLLVLFPLQAALTARSFGRYLKKRLQVLTEIAGKVGREDLNFQQEHSDIREVDEVLTSLFVMKQALQKSLKEQWEARQQKQEQVAALAHDIKTPLTIIRGNAELVQETEDLEEIREWDREILDGARQLEGYLAVLQETLRERDEGQDKEEGEETFDGCGFVRELEEKAQALGRAGQVEVSCNLPEKDVTIRGRSGIREELMRAAQNVISNGVDYCPPGTCLRITAETIRHRQEEFWQITVTDSGPGFTGEVLLHGTEQFYQGDKSRTGADHYGMGLYIARTILEEAGGYLRLENAPEAGGQVRMGVPVETG